MLPQGLFVLHVCQLMLCSTTIGLTVPQPPADVYLANTNTTGSMVCGVMRLVAVCVCSHIALVTHMIHRHVRMISSFQFCLAMGCKMWSHVSSRQRRTSWYVFDSYFSLFWHVRISFSCALHCSWKCLRSLLYPKHSTVDHSELPPMKTFPSGRHA